MLESMNKLNPLVLHIWKPVKNCVSDRTPNLTVSQADTSQTPNRIWELRLNPRQQHLSTITDRYSDRTTPQSSYLHAFEWQQPSRVVNDYDTTTWTKVGL